jgi:hypothetical protein
VTVKERYEEKVKFDTTGVPIKGVRNQVAGAWVGRDQIVWEQLTIDQELADGR